jgi:hypothetical protein
MACAQQAIDGSKQKLSEPAAPRTLPPFTHFQGDEMNASTRVLTGLANCLFTVGVLTTPGIQAQEPGPALDYGSRLVAALHELPDQALKAYYLRCERAAIQTSLGSGDVALCSLAYEILLKGTFGGDFFALLAWWRSQLKEDTESELRTREAGGERELRRVNRD